MSETINVAVLGLGRIGQQFAAGLSKHIDDGGKPIKIVAVAERDPDSLAAQMFADEDVTVYTKASDITEHDGRIDIIFDLTGAPEIRQAVLDCDVAVLAAHVNAYLLRFYLSATGMKDDELMARLHALKEDA